MMNDEWMPQETKRRVLKISNSTLKHNVHVFQKIVCIPKCVIIITAYYLEISVYRQFWF